MRLHFVWLMGAVCLTATLHTGRDRIGTSTEPATSARAPARQPLEVEIVRRQTTGALAIPSYWESLTSFHFTDDEPRRLPNNDFRLPIVTDSEAELRVPLDLWRRTLAALDAANGERVAVPLDPRLLLHVDDGLGVVTIENAQYLGPRSRIDSLRRATFACACISKRAGADPGHPRFQYHCVTGAEEPAGESPRRAGPGFLTIDPRGAATFAPAGELDQGQESGSGTLLVGRADDGDWWVWFEIEEASR